MDGSGLSPRRVLVLIKGLPPESATIAYLNGGEQFRGWDLHAYLMASIFDAIRHDTWTYVSAKSKKKPKPPEPMHRPTKAPPKKKSGWFSMMARRALNRKES